MNWSPQESAIDQAVLKVLAETGVPSASIAVSQNGELYARAYGNARLNPPVAATPEMRYKIASNGKQITAAAVLLLVEEGRLSLDDAVARFFPDLTRAREITIRQLLAHTSGYRDYYSLDYVAQPMGRDTTTEVILDGWAKIPLDFEPGARWQYSNTNYVIAGRILETVAGTPLREFLRARFFGPLGMRSVIDVHHDDWNPEDACGYRQFALGLPREAGPEGKGWMYAMGDLAMTAGDLATWSRALMEGAVLRPESLRELTTEVRLAGGSGTKYGLGLQIGTTANGNRRWSHGGGTAGFVSRNTIYPDDSASITVLTNGEGLAAETIAGKIEELVIGAVADPDAPAALERAKTMFAGLQNGKPDSALMNDDLRAYFTPQAIADYAASLKPLGAPESFTAESRQDRGGMTHRSFSVKTAKKSLRVSTYVTRDGKFAQFLVTPLGCD